jgi:hypothetical protein
MDSPEVVLNAIGAVELKGSSNGAHMTRHKPDVVQRSPTALAVALESVPGVTTFLKWTASYWPHDNIFGSERHFNRSVYIFARTAMIVWALLILISLGADVTLRSTIPALIQVTVFLDIMSVLPAHYVNNQRMQRCGCELDKVVAPECIKISTYFGLACLLTVVLSTAVLGAGGPHQLDYFSNLITLAFLQLLMTQYLTVNLFFLLLDAKVSAQLVDQLIQRAADQTLTTAALDAVREEIHSRVRNARWATDLIVAPCIASVLTIVLLIFHMYHYVRFLSSAWIIALIKELMFLFVAFWYVSIVNEKANLLTRKLSTAVWLPTILYQHNSGPSGSAGNTAEAQAELEHHPAGAIDKTSVMLCELQRLTLCVSCMNDPISFKLLWKRVSWQNVALSAAGLCLTVSVGIVRSIVIGA